MKRVAVLVLGLALILLPSSLRGSDHADPINLEVLESGITDLFAFPRGDNMIVILDVRRGLTSPPPYQLEPFEFAIHMDTHTNVTVDESTEKGKSEKARYGGSIADPAGIKEDITIKIQLKNDATLNSVKYQGLGNTGGIKVFTGVRDDPFIFPRFFRRNTIAMVLSIPFASFPNKNQQDWLLWGTSTRLKDGVQIDHVGRSNRSQQGRFDFLNTLHPSRHVAAIMAETEKRSRIEKTIMAYLPPFVNAYQPLFKIRPYDLFPDVMIYTKQYGIKFPNGRELKDDVGAQTCDQGDCALVEGSYVDSAQWPRATVNDKPFLDEFPYLAEKWDEKEIAPKPAEPLGLLGTLGAVRDVLAFTIEAVANCCSEVKTAALVTIIVLVLIVVIAVIALIGWRRCRRRATA